MTQSRRRTAVTAATRCQSGPEPWIVAREERADRRREPRLVDAGGRGGRPGP